MMKRPPLRKSRPDGRRRGKLRPAEFVRKFVLAELARPAMQTGSRLPTIRQIATRLRVSMPTVQTVFRELTREGRIRTEVGNGTFLVSKYDGKRQDLRIALSFPMPDDSLGSRWGRQICAGIMEAAAKSQRNIQLLPLPQEAREAERAQARLLSQRGEVDGLISFPPGISNEIRQAYERDGKPVVEVNPPSDSACANFVSPDYYNASLRLGAAWRETGRKQVVLMLYWPLAESLSSQLRLAGLVNGLGYELGRSITCRSVVVDRHADAEGHLTGRLLDQWRVQPAEAPDAVYCVSDVMALEVVAGLLQRGIKAPHDVSVAGGTGLDLQETACPELTRTRQPLEKMGAELFAMLCERIARRGEAFPAKILATRFIGGATTRAEENARLKIAPAPAFGLAP
ncbi:MAG: LacI family DNA-binding transcriptional regulator [Verrucomicrobia bacterium]|nr:LacI family DNA-binding transcriptional regulator [Verrucomicrobiota bacterium]